MPRAQIASTGLRGPGAVHFPEAAKQTGRDLGLDSTADLYARARVSDGAGGWSTGWELEESGVPARIDTMSGNAAESIAEQVNELSTHVLSLEPGHGLLGTMQVEIDGVRWEVLNVMEASDALVTRAEVRQA